MTRRFLSLPSPHHHPSDVALGESRPLADPTGGGGEGRGEKGKGNRNRPDQPVTYLRVPAAVSTLSSPRDGGGAGPEGVPSREERVRDIYS